MKKFDLKIIKVILLFKKTKKNHIYLNKFLMTKEPSKEIKIPPTNSRLLLLLLFGGHNSIILQQ
jgi:hypothetical protein